MAKKGLNATLKSMGTGKVSPSSKSKPIKASAKSTKKK